MCLNVTLYVYWLSCLSSSRRTAVLKLSSYVLSGFVKLYSLCSLWQDGWLELERGPLETSGYGFWPYKLLRIVAGI